MHQLNLFAQSIAEPIRAYRKRDPASSRIAYETIKDDGGITNQRTKVYLAVADFPDRTAIELSKLAKIERYAVSRRLPELERLGHVERLRGPDGNPTLRNCTVGGRPSCVWRKAK